MSNPLPPRSDPASLRKPPVGSHPIPNQGSRPSCAGASGNRPVCSFRRGVSGFTLVELLVVIAIIALLAALAFPTLSKMSARSSQSKAASNFRGLGAAIMTYAAENDQKLPGLQANHRCAYRVSSPNQIGSVLYQQMGLPAPAKDFRPVPLLRVPALGRWLLKYQKGDPNQAAHTVAYEVTMPDGTKKQPFGWPQSGTPSLKVHQIPNPSKTWAVYELGGTGDPNPFVNLKSFPEPIHGDKRTVLFFDGHVEVVPSSAPKPTY
jgi:prepilin-type N-terminal cleavage/methylation domain-containing protein/prepilin-type processing-associated H-X9-DG protein